MKTFWFLLLWVGLAGVAAADAQDGSRSPRFLVHLLDYLAKDYYGAVAPGGKVLSDSEFKEQNEFAESAEATAKGLPELSGHGDVLAGVAQLKALIAAKSEPGDVSRMARALQQQVIEITKLEIAPAHWPSLATGRELFNANCVTCHGTSGRGDGPAAAALNPKPANLMDPEKMADVSPLQAFNTVRLGVPNTGMPPFPALSDADAWAVAFYAVSLRHAGAGAPPKDLFFDAVLLKQVATGSDKDLSAALGPLLPIVRVHSEENESSGGGQAKSLEMARALMAEALVDYRAGNQDSAKTKALKAYLEGIEPVEPRLRATDAAAVSELELKMSEVRSAIDGHASPSEVEAAMIVANARIDAARMLIEHKDMAPGVAFAASSAILLREGFEAVLLILALLGVIRASGSKTAALWVHAGWISALALGGVAWAFSGLLIDISGAQRELLEGVTSLFAVLVLLVVGFWLHSRTEIGRWNRFLRVKVRAALDQKRLFGLFGVAFVAVFREAFETVLFLRAIWLEGGAPAKTAMAAGVGLTLALVILGAWAVLRYSTRIPVRKLFGVSAFVMAALAFILTGKGLHSMQETGMVGVTTASLPLHSDLLGIYPTWETLGSQVLVLAVIFALWAYGKRPSPRADTPASGSAAHYG